MKKSKFLFLLIFISYYLFSTTTKSDERFEIGKDIFLVKGNCASCHILDDAGSDGQIGPSLDMIKPELETVINVVTNGMGVMPPYVDELTSNEIEAVAYYVSTSVTN